MTSRTGTQEEIETSRPTLSARLAAAAGAEVRKTWSLPAIRATLALGVLGVAGLALFGVLQTIRYEELDRIEEIGGLSSTDWPLLALHFGQVIPILLGAWIVGQDMATGPRRTAHLAVSSRATLLAVKYGTVMMVTVIAGLACSLAALVPLLADDAPAGTEDLPSRLGWLIGYWVLIGLVSAGITAGTRSTALAVVPLLAWNLGISDFLARTVPAVKGGLDQVFKAGYQDLVTPSGQYWLSIAVQVAVILVAGSLVFHRSDTR